MSLVRIQQKDYGEWKNIKITRIQTSDEEIVVGGHFRVLVDGETVFDNKADTGVNRSPTPTTKMEMEK